MTTLPLLLNALLPGLLVGLAVVWLALSLYLAVTGRRARDHASAVGRTLAEIRRIEQSGEIPGEQLRQLGVLAASIDRLMVLRVASSLPERSHASEMFARSA